MFVLQLEKKGCSDFFGSRSVLTFFFKYDIIYG